MAAHQAPPSLGFSRQEHWSGLPFPSPMHESEKWKWSRSVVSDSLQPHGLQPIRLLCPWDFPGKDIGVGCHFLLQGSSQPRDQTQVSYTAGRSFTNWATREYTHILYIYIYIYIYICLFIQTIKQENGKLNYMVLWEFCR